MSESGGASKPTLPGFTERLNYLWQTRLSPRGTPYTLREVHEGTGRKLSQSYLSLLRKGGIAEPSGEKLQVLADFFGVSVTYFTATEVPRDVAAADIDPELLEALRSPMVREIALRAARMGQDEWELVLHMMHHTQTLVDRLKSAPPAPGPGATMLPDAQGDPHPARSNDDPDTRHDTAGP